MFWLPGLWTDSLPRKYEGYIRHHRTRRLINTSQRQRVRQELLDNLKRREYFRGAYDARRGWIRETADEMKSMMDAYDNTLGYAPEIAILNEH